MVDVIDFPAEIICGVRYNGQFAWYVSERDLWFLDYTIFIHYMEKAGYHSQDIPINSKRRDTMVLVKENAELFLKQLVDAQMKTEDLRELLLTSVDEVDDSWYYDFQPSLYIDFDANQLYSWYSEHESFEHYVPAHWTGHYQQFSHLIPERYRYWIHDGDDIFSRKY